MRRARVARPRGWLPLAALVFAATPLAAQRWLGVQALFDVEGWRTDGRSTLLSREQPTAALARAYLLWVIEPRRGVQIVGGNEVEGATDEREVELEVDHLTVRLAPHPIFIVDLGRVAQPVGTFAPRRFSAVNPLIGIPDGYPVSYPVGVMVSGATASVDYRAALVTLPPTNPAYVPEPGAYLRPAVGVGLTPVIGVRVGASWSSGPYLSDADAANVPAGTRWQDYGSRVLAADLRFARGYFELFAELAASWYEVPTIADDVKGTTYYVEMKYTWSPRFFTAVRAERNLYAFIRHSPSGWIARATDFVDGEVGVGYRLSARTLVKASYRADNWEITPATQAFLGEGSAFALQLSYRLGN
jgi:hypothetical protein